MPMSIDQALRTLDLRRATIDDAVMGLDFSVPTNVPLDEAKTRIEALDSSWERYEELHENILIKADSGNLHEKIQEDQFLTTRRKYIIFKSQLRSVVSAYEQKTRGSDVSISANRQSNAGTSSSARVLPQISLPSFSGDYHSWKPFCDLFKSLVIDHEQLSDVEKLHYLRSCVTGKAAPMLADIPVSGENLIVAWNKFKAKYENRRVLCRRHLASIFKRKQLKSPSSTELHELVAAVKEALGALKALHFRTEAWDPFIVYHLTENLLDSSTYDAWEHARGASQEMETFEELEAFLEKRATALEGIEEHKSSLSTQVSVKPSPGPLQKPKKVNTASISAPQAHSEASKSSNQCAMCQGDHYINKCSAFLSHTPSERKADIIVKKLCFNCLGPHFSRDCKSVKTCLKCQKKHHALIHDVYGAQESKSSAVTPKDGQITHPQDTSSAVVHHSARAGRSGVRSMLLATAQVKIINENGVAVVARALVDQGSEISFITEYLVSHLNLKRNSLKIPLVGIGGTRASTTKGSVLINLQPAFESDRSCLITAHILPRLTACIPSLKPINLEWPHLQGIQLADPSFLEPGAVDLILGADVYGRILLNGMRKGYSEAPIGQLSIFGWIISGPTQVSHEQHVASVNLCLEDQALHETVKRFWQQEELASDPSTKLSKDDEKCEEIFVNTHVRDSSGRYSVRLPFKEPSSLLGNSRNLAVKVLKSLERRLKASPELSARYHQFLEEYHDLDHMRKAPNDTQSTEQCFYLPHHGVLRESSTTTKLRVVFNGSACSSSGRSLNELLHTGAKLQIDLPDVLTWFRSHRCVFSADMEKMYRQIKVQPPDWDFQRILWLENNKIVEYQLTTVTYGLACAPWLALRVVNQLVTDEGANFPQAVPALTMGRYVDDVFGGADTPEACKQVVHEVDSLCRAGCLPLAKWTSSNPSVVQDLPSQNQSNNESRE